MLIVLVFGILMSLLMNHESFSKTMLLYTFFLNGWNSSLYDSRNAEWWMHKAVTCGSMSLEQTNVWGISV